MRYTYKLTMGDFQCSCSDVKAVVARVNQRTGCSVLTADMVNTLFTRPHKANKRLFSHIQIERERLPTKGELARAELDKIQALVDQAK